MLEKEMIRALDELIKLVEVYKRNIDALDNPGRAFYPIRQAIEVLADFLWIFEIEQPPHLKKFLGKLQNSVDEASKNVWLAGIEKMKNDTRFKDCTWIKE